jgi:anti-sigma factor RsiW
MKAHDTKWISALLDGELSGLRRFFVKRHLRGCALCAAEYRRLRHVRELLATAATKPEMGDSPAFFWSKVKREIQAREGRTVAAPFPRSSPLDWLGAHRLAFASVAVAVVAAGLWIWMEQAGRPAPKPTVAVAALPPPRPIVERVSTVIPNAVATTVDTKDKDVTVIWMSGLPWTPNMTAMKTKFAHLGT